jgi:hypothetical protein
MNSIWIAAVVGAAGGLLGGLVGMLITHNRPDSKSNRTVMTVFVVVCAVAANQLAAPWVQGWYAAQTAESSLLDNSLYPVLKKYEPEAYAKVLAEYKLAVRDSSRMDIFQNLVIAEVSAVATRRMAHASQDALINLFREVLANMKTLSAHEDACFRYLFPQVAGPPDISKYLDKQSQDRTLALLTEVVRTAAENPVPLPDGAQAQEKLAPVINALYAEFGSDTQMLANASAPGVDRAKVCKIAIALYDGVLALPPPDAAAALRSMTQL